MPIITKVEATKVANAFNQMLFERAFNQIASAAQAGLLSTIVPYGNANAAAATLANGQLTVAGWTVVQDDIGRTLTIS